VPSWGGGGGAYEQSCRVYGICNRVTQEVQEMPTSLWPDVYVHSCSVGAVPWFLQVQAWVKVNRLHRILSSQQPLKHRLSMAELCAQPPFAATFRHTVTCTPCVLRVYCLCTAQGEDEVRAVRDASMHALSKSLLTAASKVCCSIMLGPTVITICLSLSSQSVCHMLCVRSACCVLFALDVTREA
jgi:hypothetical protein